MLLAALNEHLDLFSCNRETNGRPSYCLPSVENSNLQFSRETRLPGVSGYAPSRTDRNLIISYSYVTDYSSMVVETNMSSSFCGT